MLKILQITLLFLAVSVASYAQADIKIAHVDTDNVLISLPEYPAASKQLEAFGKQLSDQIANKEKEYETKGKKLQLEKDDLIPIILEERVKELKQLEESIVSFQKTAQESMKQKQGQLFTPLMVKIQKEINRVSKADGYAFIFPIQAFLYAENKNDLTATIIKNLGGTVKE